MRILVALLALSPLLGAAQPRSAIRKTDFRNFRYVPACGGAREAVRVNHGEFRRDSPPEARLWMKVLWVGYGDLDRDGLEEAAVHTVCNTGGSGEFTQVFVYDVRGGRTVAVAGLKPGDRAFGGIAGAKIIDGKLAVTRKHGKAACCPEELVTTTYRLRAGKLIAVGTPVGVRYQAPAETVPAAPPAPPPFPAGEWLLQELAGKRVAEGFQATIRFADGGKISGSGGCNLFSATAAIDGGRWKVGPLAATMRACPAELMDQESRYLEALGNLERTVTKGSNLFVYSKGMKQPLMFSRLAP